MNLAIPLQLAQRLPAAALNRRSGTQVIRYTPAQLASADFWAQLDAASRRAIRLVLISQVRTWQQSGLLDAWPLELQGQDVSLRALQNDCPREAKALAKAGFTTGAHFVPLTAGALLRQVAGRIGTLLRVLHGLEQCQPREPLDSIDSATAPTEPLSQAEIEAAIAAAGAAQRNDLRLGSLLQTAQPEALTVASALTPQLQQPLHSPSIVTLVREILHLDQLDVSADLRDVAARLALCFPAEKRPRNTAIFAERYGASGDDSSTLQSVADRHRLTRERVRQIVQKMLARCEQRPVYSPAFQRLQEATSRLLPGSVDDCELQLAPLLGGLQMRGAIDYGREVLQQKLAVAEIKLPYHLLVKERLLSQTEEQEGCGDLLIAARRMIMTHGAAYLPAVVASIAPQTKGLTMTAAARLAQMLNGFEWLIEGEWFWLGPPQQRNRIDLMLRKIISVSPQWIDIEDLYAAIARFTRQDPDEASLFPPPVKVIKGICERTPWLDCRQANDFRANVVLNPVDQLSKVEHDVYTFMAAHHGVASRWMLSRALTANGHPDPVPILSGILSRSVIIRPLGRGVFGLPGWPLDPAALAVAQAEVGGENIAAAHQVDGSYEWTVVLTPGSLNNGQHSVPSSISEDLPPGEYQVAGGAVLRVGANYPAIRGIATYAKQRRWPVNGRVQVRLDPRQRQATLGLLLEQKLLVDA